MFQNKIHICPIHHHFKFPFCLFQVVCFCRGHSQLSKLKGAATHLDNCFIVAAEKHKQRHTTSCIHTHTYELKIPTFQFESQACLCAVGGSREPPGCKFTVLTDTLNSISFFYLVYPPHHLSSHIIIKTSIKSHFKLTRCQMCVKCSRHYTTLLLLYT